MLKIYNYLKKYIFYMIVLIAILLILIITYYLNSTKKVITNVEEKILEEKIVKNYFKVDIKGAVVTPGVYELEENQRVIDVINKAGGVTENANTNLINLSKKITDEMIIIIYTNDEIREYNEGKIKTEYVYIEVDNCPDKINNACINSYKEESDNSIININTASIEELIKLNGIGEAKAQSIIEYRENNGNYEKIDDLINVKGINTSLIEKNKDNITV